MSNPLAQPRFEFGDRNLNNRNNPLVYFHTHARMIFFTFHLVNFFTPFLRFRSLAKHVFTTYRRRTGKQLTIAKPLHRCSTMHPLQLSLYTKKNAPSPIQKPGFSTTSFFQKPRMNITSPAKLNNSFQTRSSSSPPYHTAHTSAPLPAGMLQTSFGQTEYKATWLPLKVPWHPPPPPCWPDSLTFP